MSLFGFVSDIGKSLFGDDSEAAENIKSHIEANNPGVTGLEVEFDDGVVSLCGECASAEAMQKAVLMAGNVKGVEDVKVDKMTIASLASDPAAVTAALEQDSVEYYIIESGDSLSKIAKEAYGDAMQYPKIFEANREVIEDPDLIYPGQKIRIPK